MRKLYWGCTAVGLATLGLLHAADYTQRHPDTIAGRCAIGMYHASLNCGPLCRVGICLAERMDAEPGDCEDELADIPDEPEPVAAEEPCPSEPEKADAFGTHWDENRGRLPGKIIIDEGEEPPLADLRFTAQYHIEGIGNRLAGEALDAPRGLEVDPVEGLLGRTIEAVGKLFDGARLGSGSSALDDLPVEGGITRSVSADDCRPMPYCTDDDEPELPPMPYADEPDAPRPKKAAPRIWNLFPPKGTEVGSQEEPELSPNGNDCREDSSLQIPGVPLPSKGVKQSHDAAPTGEEPSEPPPPDKKKSKPADPPQAKRTFDASRLLPFAAPVKLDTMEFRPSDWGKNDVPLPPF